MKSLICEHDNQKEIMDIKDYYRTVKFFSLGRELLKLFELCLSGDEYRFLDFINAYRGLIKIYYSDELNTIGDMKKYTKILKNS